MKRGKYSRNIIAIASLASLTCVMIPPKAKSSYVVQGETTAYSIENTVETEEPVCYITTNSKTTFYTSIEGALAVAAADSGSQTVYVIPGDATTTTTIYKDCTIASEDSLVLPYSATLDESTYTYSDEVYTNGDNYNSTDAFADASATNVSNYRKSLVYMDDGVTLTVNGTLIIGGQTGRANSGVSGNTNGDYCEINLGEDSKIVAQSGSVVNIWGYIKETSSNNGSTFEVENGATVQLPLVIYDYKGGSATYGIYKKSTICPFKLFDFPNVHSMMDFYYGSTLNCQYKLYVTTGSNAFTGTTTVIGTKGSFLNLEEGSHVTFKYQPKSFGYSSTFSSTDTTTTDIGIYGTMSLGYISVSLSLIVSMSISTSDYELPISYRLSFTVHDGATLNIDYSVKLMPGSVTTIEEGGTVKLGNNASLIAYDNTYTEAYSSSSMKYPKTGGNYYAKLVNNGTFNVNSGSAFGGMLYTENADAIFDILNGTTSVTSTWDSATSGSSLTASCTTASMTLVASGYIGSNDNLAKFNKNTYSSRGTYWGVKDKYMITFKMHEHDYTIPDTIQFTAGDTTVSYDSDSGTFDASIAVDGTDTISLSDVTGVRSFKDADGNEITSLSNITDDTVVYIEPKAAYTVTLNLTADTDLTYLAFNYTIDNNTTTEYVIDNTSTNSGISNGTLTTLALLEGTALSFENVRGVQSFSVSNGSVVKGNMTVDITPATTVYTMTIYFTYSTTNNGGTTSYTVLTTPSGSSSSITLAEVTEGSTDAQHTYKYVSGETWNINDQKNMSTDSSSGTVYDNFTVYITGKNGSLCILPDTPILMADDTYKKAIDVKPGDLVWAFNHETGRFEKTVIILNPHLKAGTNLQDVLRITMESGRQIGIVNEHGFFCVEENKYVYVNANNYTEYIGKHFISVDPETKELIKDRVVDITYNQEITKTCSPVSKMNLDVITADMISIPGGIRGWFNFFEFSKDELMKYDEEKMKADIEKYGLATADDFAPDTPERAFEIMPLKYFTVSVGKGHATWAKLLDDLAVYGPEIYEGMKNY